MSDDDNQNQKVHVTIDGQDYAILGQGNEERIREVAGFVDEQISSIRQQTQTNSPARLAILTALNIAHELFMYKREKEQALRNEKQMAQEIKEISDNIERHMKEI